jgi:hypothetical protein
MTAGYCGECDSNIELQKDSHMGLFLKCECGLTRPIRVSQATPNTWQV